MRGLSLGTDCQVIDLFCGIGGMTHGFVLEGLPVIAGIDIDKSCKYSYELNNRSRFIEKDIAKVNSEDLNKLYGPKTKTRILIGCAPCQPFSTLNLGRSLYEDKSGKWDSLRIFANLIKEVKPEIVSMENVKELIKDKKYPVFKAFLNTLRKNKYFVHYEIVDASDYGVPQKRKRLVLLASRLGPIKLIPKTHLHHKVTVRDVISDLKSINAGGENKKDQIHKSSRLSELNMKRIKSTPHDGGGAKQWDDGLLLECYKKPSGKTYMSSVYGRMKWDQPAPTITTHFLNLGTGRFGHPVQNRAISIREAARIQTFPDSYIFSKPDNFKMTIVARHIGNAVPVLLGRVIAQSIKQHLGEVSLH